MIQKSSETSRLMQSIEENSTKLSENYSTLMVIFVQLDKYNFPREHIFKEIRVEIRGIAFTFSIWQVKTKSCNQMQKSATFQSPLLRIFLSPKFEWHKQMVLSLKSLKMLRPICSHCSHYPNCLRMKSSFFLRFLLPFLAFEGLEP